MIRRLACAGLCAVVTGCAFFKANAPAIEADALDLTNAVCAAVDVIDPAAAVPATIACDVIDAAGNLIAHYEATMPSKQAAAVVAKHPKAPPKPVSLGSAPGEPLVLRAGSSPITCTANGAGGLTCSEGQPGSTLISSGSGVIVTIRPTGEVLGATGEPATAAEMREALRVLEVPNLDRRTWL